MTQYVGSLAIQHMVDRMIVQRAIPKMISMLGGFYIGRMLTPDVDFASNPPEGKNQNERDRGGRHELHQWAPGQRRHKGLSQQSPDAREVVA